MRAEWDAFSKKHPEFESDPDYKVKVGPYMDKVEAAWQDLWKARAAYMNAHQTVMKGPYAAYKKLWDDLLKVEKDYMTVIQKHWGQWGKDYQTFMSGEYKKHRDMFK